MERFVVVATTLLLAAGCLTSDVRLCSNGTVCPVGTECVAGTSLCATKDQLSACEETSDGIECSANGADGSCHSGVCVLPNCGDGIRVQPEECDDGDLGEDSCASQGFYEQTTGLACDTNCRFDTSGCIRTCGDGVVNPEELCDGDGEQPQFIGCVELGFDYGVLRCTGTCLPDFATCDNIGWGAQQQPNATLHFGVWGVADDDVHAVGMGGSIMHFDGVTWTESPSPTTVDLFSIHGTEPDDLYVVGRDGVTLHFDGSTWSEMTSGVDAHLFDVWVRSTDDVFAVGAPDTDGRATVIHFDGTSWSAVTPGDTPMLELRSVWAGGGKVYVGGGSSQDSPPEIHLLDAGVWSQQSVPSTFETGDGLFGVITDFWGDANGLNYAVGSDLNFLDRGFILSKAGGDAWDLDYETASGIAAIHGRSQVEGFAVGVSGLIHRLDGAGWTTERPISGNLWGVWWGATRAHAVGTGGRLLESNGSRFSTLPVGMDSAVSAVLPRGKNDIVVVGTEGAITGRADEKSTIFRYFEGDWKTMAVPSVDVALRDGWLDGPSDLKVAVGDSALILTCVGVCDEWTYSPSNITTLPLPALNAVWGTAATNIYAVGARGSLVQWNGSIWTVLPLPTGLEAVNLSDIHGTGPDDIYVSGAGGVLLHSTDGVTFVAVNVGASADFASVWAAPSGEIHLGTNNGRLWYFDGSTWEIRGNVNGRVAEIYGTAPDDVYALSESRVHRFDGATWSEVRSPAVQPLEDVRAFAGSLFFGGHGGQLHRLDPPSPW